MPRRLTVPALAVVLLLPLISSATFARDLPAAETGSGGALLEALSRVPDTTATREAPLSYLDQAALVAARPGAAQPASVAEALALVEAQDPAARLWLAAFMGAASGDTDLLRGLGRAGGWPQALGFDLLDVDRHLSFGTPPGDGSVLLGAFDPQAVAQAFSARGYSSSEAGEWLLLCGAAGCEAGMDVNLAAADPSLPFGAAIGRSEPVAIAADAILSSADLATITAMTAAAAGDVASLAEDRAYRALALAGDPDVTLVQATFLPGGMLGIGPDIYQLLGASPEEAARLIGELADSLEPMPPAAAAAILDGATPDEQVVSIALAYEDEADAATAVEVVPRRLKTMPAVSSNTPLADLLADRGVTSVTASVQPAGPGTMAVARVEVRAPLPSDEFDGASGQPTASSGLYRLFVDLVSRRDLLWLVPVLPLE